RTRPATAQLVVHLVVIKSRPFPDDGVECVLRAVIAFVTASADADGAGHHPVDDDRHATSAREVAEPLRRAIASGLYPLLELARWALPVCGCLGLEDRGLRIRRGRTLHQVE